MKFEFGKEVSKDTFALLSRNQEWQTCFLSRPRDFISSSGLFSGGSWYFLHPGHFSPRG